ncbi:hypothetical protein SCH01S_34_00160 [Sphingomonas changbaiensis NBRC 104936]|uniref:Uncharacterized protein n=1 Tax=Sphingomonas changbaiensis NBRC 104936 TaxID=1219043 RepID=A0A0E9MPZ3_9SPHN|nr:hypothetical protein SCH01S_34_00160 [Sphingomonas changbaiensis NBRC 104936]
MGGDNKSAAEAMSRAGTIAFTPEGSDYALPMQPGDLAGHAGPTAGWTPKRLGRPKVPREMG